jgi:hypothetical protein
MEMESEQDFRLGFWFALMLARTMGFNTTPQAIYDQLRSVADGDLTLMPSPEDALRDAQAGLGRLLSEPERELIESCLPKNRTEQDARNRELASLILRLMGQPT